MEIPAATTPEVDARAKAALLQEGLPTASCGSNTCLIHTALDASPEGAALLVVWMMRMLGRCAGNIGASGPQKPQCATLAMSLRERLTGAERETKASPSGAASVDPVCLLFYLLSAAARIDSVASLLFAGCCRAHDPQFLSSFRLYLNAAMFDVSLHSFTADTSVYILRGTMADVVRVYESDTPTPPSGEPGLPGARCLAYRQLSRSEPDTDPHEPQWPLTRADLALSAPTPRELAGLAVHERKAAAVGHVWHSTDPPPGGLGVHLGLGRSSG